MRAKSLKGNPLFHWPGTCAANGMPAELRSITDPAEQGGRNCGSRILVPLDGTPFSSTIISWVCRVFNRTDLDLVLVQAARSPPVRYAEGSYESPVDGGGEVTGDECSPIRRAPPPLSEQEPTAKVFQTALQVVDLLVPFPKDGKIGLFGGAEAGKTVLVQELSRDIAVQAGSEVSALVGRMLSAADCPPTLASEMDALQGTDHFGEAGVYYAAPGREEDSPSLPGFSEHHSHPRHGRAIGEGPVRGPPRPRPRTAWPSPSTIRPTESARSRERAGRPVPPHVQAAHCGSGAMDLDLGPRPMEHFVFRREVMPGVRLQGVPFGLAPPTGFEPVFEP